MDCLCVLEIDFSWNNNRIKFRIINKIIPVSIALILNYIKIYLGLWRFEGGGESSTAMSDSLSSSLTVVVSSGRGSIGWPGGSLDLWIEAWGVQMGGCLLWVSLMLRGLPKGLPMGLPRGLPRGLCSFCGFSSFLISSSDTSSWWRLLMQEKSNFYFRFFVLQSNLMIRNG